MSTQTSFITKKIEIGKDRNKVHDAKRTDFSVKSLKSGSTLNVDLTVWETTNLQHEQVSFDINFIDHNTFENAGKFAVNNTEAGLDKLADWMQRTAMAIKNRKKQKENKTAIIY